MSTQGYVIGPTEGEHLIRNDGSVYFIRVDPSRGSNNMALGTQQVPIRTGIRVHQHQEADEVLFVLEGSGFGMLGDARMAVEKGSAIYVPQGVWHGVENPDSELLLLWVVAPPGLEAFFRGGSQRSWSTAKATHSRTIERNCPETRDAAQVTRSRPRWVKFSTAKPLPSLPRHVCRVQQLHGF
jgi:mannose-6-phosphate isomerase-like protein (cupin superfamily)